MTDPLTRLREALADRYVIDREVGRGGMATVYLGSDLKHGRRVAIKLMRPEIASAVGTERFQREIETAASLSHPHILPLHDSGEVEGLLYCVMPFVEGETLSDRLRQGPLPISRALRIARQVADALDYAHQRGVIHRDIKPGNVLLTGKHAVVADFGICKAAEAAGGERLTTSGIIIGTPTYMSPEQGAAGSPVDGRSDTYSLGCVLYEMLIGEPPFSGASAHVVIARHMQETVPSLSVARPTIAPAVEDLVRKSLAKTPADRYGTAAEFAKELRHLETDARVHSVASGLAGAPGRLGRTVGGWRRLLEVLVLLGVIGTAVTVFRSQVLEPGDAYAVDNPERNFIVLPHRLATTGEAEEVLAQEAAAELTRLLQSWREVRAVPNPSLPGLLFDEGLEDPVRSSLRESMRVARRARAGTLVALTVDVRQDSALLEAVQYDVASQEERGSAIVSVADPADLYALVAPVAGEMLELSGAPSDMRMMRRQSDNLTAVQRLQEGKRHLDRWELEPAEEAFRRSLAGDSTIALANHYLAMTLYFQAARDPNRLVDLGGPIRRLAGAARRYGAELPYRDSLHVDGFSRFADGRLGPARNVYATLLASDTLDSYAWLMLGSVERHDPRLQQRPDELSAPRRNLNVAVRAFERAIQNSPDFYLGYAHLVDMHAELAEAVSRGICSGFEPPGDEPSLIWEVPDHPETLTYLCPVMLDSIVWVDRETLPSLDPILVEEGPGRLLRRAEVPLMRWENYAPQSPQPHDQLSRLLLAQRRHRASGGPQLAADSMVYEALAHASSALALRSDTTPEDLIRLGSLLLGAGESDSALTITELGLDRHAATRVGETAPPRLATNVLLAAGELSRALDVLQRSSANREIYAAHLTEGGPVRVWVEPEIARLQAYGATGYLGSELQASLARIEETWTSRGYGDAQKKLFRQTLTRYIGPALALDGEVVREWISGWAEVPPIWAGLAVAEADPESAREFLYERLEPSVIEELSPVTAYLAGRLAQRVGEHELALQLYERLRLSALDLEVATVTWGLSSLSHLLSARSLAALGDSEAAGQHSSIFLERWKEADPALADYVEEARLVVSSNRE